MHIRFVLALLAAAALLTACGGNTATMTPVPFTSFSAITSGQPVTANGISQTVNAKTVGFNNVTSTTINGPPDTTNSSAQFTYSGIGIAPVVSAFSFSAPTSSASFSAVTCNATTSVCSAQGVNTVGAMINPLAPAGPASTWNYQSFGYWLVVLSGTTVVGAMSFGSPATVASLPATGTAAYSGVAGGTYVDPNGAVFVQAAQMLATADFGPARSVAFSTSNTTIAPINVSTTTPALALNLTGSLTIMPGTNQFSGTVSAPGGAIAGFPTAAAMTGNATGQFYGPIGGSAPPTAPLEIGGIYSLKAATNPQTMLGGFGGRHP